MNRYEIKATNMYTGHEGTWEIEALNEDELKKMPLLKSLSIESIKLIGEVEEKKEETNNCKNYIPDAEALLFEMDANNIDSITIFEGFGNKKTYTRFEIERYLNI